MSAPIDTPIAHIKPNPDNPRVIRDDRFRKLVKSIREFPQMLALRPIVVNRDMVILGGNMRLRACIEAGLTTVPVVKALNLTPEQEREFVVKDNSNFGEWDWDMLANEWPMQDLSDWGVDLPFSPNLDPSTAHDAITDADIAKAASGINGQYDNVKQYKTVMCPHCAKDFNIDE